MATIPHLPDSGVLIRRSLFFLVLIILTLGNLFVLFGGLNSPQAMDQAQIAREIARGNGFTTKMIRPVAYSQAEQANQGMVSLSSFPDTYHSPLNPLINAAVLKVVGADVTNSWQMNKKELIYPLDRVIATVSTLFFLMAIGMSYLLVSRIFDAKIAGVTALLMLFCDVFWQYSLSGLPQMLMMLLFSCGIYFAYRSVEISAEGRSPMIPALVAGLFFTLLTLTHWMAAWIALGYIIYAAVAFRPRGIIGLLVLFMVMIAAVGPMIRNNSMSGTPFGTAFLTLYNGLASGSEESIMRAHDITAQPLVLDGLLLKVLSTMLLQASDIVFLLGGIIVAPMFFISLLHPFKRASIANFRWLILLMWVLTTFGLAFFGLTKESPNPNQLHLLYAPIMTAYGLAFISILWSRLNVVSSVPALRNVHFFIIVGICALPLMLTLPSKATLGLRLRDRGGFPNWPPYYALGLNSLETGLKKYVSDKQVIFSDQPWAVAWYADRVSIWLPAKRDGFVKLENAASSQQTPVAGILISPISHGSGPMRDVAARYGDFTSMVIDGRVGLATYPPGFSVYDKDPKLQEISKRYPFRIPLVSLDMVFYGDRAPRAKEDGN